MIQAEAQCIFCLVAAKHPDAVILYENEDALAFLDINPITRGHSLIIPKKHCRNLFDFEDSMAQGVMHATRVVACAIRLALNSDGISLLQSNEQAAGQHVFHFHFHLIPRFMDDNLKGQNAEGLLRRGIERGHPTRRDLDSVADRIRSRIVDF